MPHRSLDAAAIARTIELPCQRVEVRSPGSGLSGLTTALAGKAWQKLAILYAMEPGSPAAGPPVAGA